MSTAVPESLFAVEGNTVDLKPFEQALLAIGRSRQPDRNYQRRHTVSEITFAEDIHTRCAGEPRNDF